MKLKPRDGLRLIDERQSEWLAVSLDPQFELDIDTSLAGQWIRLRFDIEPTGGWASCPVLYIDCGGGFLGHRAIRLPRPAPGETRVDFVFPLPEDLQRARLNPMAQRGSFRLGEVSVKRMSKPMAGLAMALEVMKQNRLHDWLPEVLRCLWPVPSLRRIRSLMFWFVRRYRQREEAQAYADWISHFEPQEDSYRELISAQAKWSDAPRISVVMPVYNPPLDYLDAAIRSVRAQIYPHWELCIADDASTDLRVREVLRRHQQADARIKVALREQNGHIAAASNSGLEMATGEFVALLDHDDLLHPLALHYVAEVIVRRPDVGLIFTDEDKLNSAGKRFDPYFKCELNYELLLAQNMISHLGVYRCSLVRNIGGFRMGLEGSQDYDLALRVIERLAPTQVVHVPRVLYHWRAVRSSTALTPEEKPYAAVAARTAISEHLARRGLRAEVMAAPESPHQHRVRFSLPDPAPMVSIIIPTRDKASLLGACIESIFARTTYPRYEVIVVDNGSMEDQSRDLFRRLSGRVHVLRDDSSFNFSRLNNIAVEVARGDVVCLLNNDTEVITEDWLQEMVSFALLDEVGAVGARLWYPDDTLQHAGIVLGVDGIARHAHQFLKRGHPGYFGRAVLHQSFSAVTGACLAVRRALYLEVGGMDESLPVAFNDVDFCLRLTARGYRNVWTPYAELHHHESATRGEDLSRSNRQRLRTEERIFEERWTKFISQDPSFSPNLSLVGDGFGFAWPPRLASSDVLLSESCHASINDGAGQESFA